MAGETQLHVGAPSRTRLAAALDGATDGALVSFAVWTVFYELALWARWSVLPGAAVWCVLAVLTTVGAALLAVRRERRAAAPTVDPGPALPWWALPVVAAVVAGLVVVVRPAWGLLPVTVGLVLLLLGLVLWSGRVPRAEGVLRDRPRARVAADLVVLVVALGVAYLALHLLKPDADDTFFVNRSVWVAGHGVPSLRDTLYGPENLPLGYAGGLPLASVETLFGAIARLTGLQAGTVTYLVALPVFAFAVVWTTWRLCRAWAPSRALLVFAVAVAYVLTCAESTVGSYSLGRLWQGKAFAFAFLTPLIWVYVAELLQRRDRARVLLLLAAGTAFVGLASTATLQAPMIALPVLLVAAYRRDRLLAAGGAALLAAPVVAGLVVVLNGGSVAGEDPVPIPLDVSFSYLAGLQAAMIVLTLVALALGPFLVRRETSDVVLVGSLGVLVMLLPGAFALANVVSGAGPVLWRMLLGVPSWVLVGLLVTAVPARASSHVARGASALVAAVIAVTLLVAGTPQWSERMGATLTSAPTWKVDQRALDDVRALHGLETSDGPWLLPPLHMEVMPIVTDEHFPVVPRGYYLPGPEVNPGDQAARTTLYQAEVVAGTAPLPELEPMRAGLAQLDVSLVCASREDAPLVARLDEIGPETHRVAGLVCLRLDEDGNGIAW